MQPNKFIVKKHTNENRLILAVCDPEVFGKTYEAGDLIVDVSSSFFKGEEIEETELLKLISQAYMITAVGTKSIGLLARQNLVDPEKVLKIENVPYASVVFEAMN